MSVDPNDPRPAYVQIAAELQAAIERGELQPGQRIQSARALTKAYGVSITTAQKAVDALKSEGVLVSHPPRGVFVAGHSGASADDETPSNEYVEIMRHLDEIQAHLGRVDTRLTDLERQVQPGSSPEQ